MTNQEKNYILAFNYLFNLTLLNYNSLLSYFGSLEKAFYASGEELIKSGLRPKIAFDFVKRRKFFNLEKVLRDDLIEGIKYCFLGDGDYPCFLSKIYSPPLVLYYQGNLDVNWNISLSVVGSRLFSAYGAKIISEFIPSLVSEGINIVSGLAIGIDSLAHFEALRSSGRAIAVLGSSLRSRELYPAINSSLARDIILNNGLLLSEFPIGRPLSPQNFPQRNRIIAGLSPATLIVEAALKSGSLITARYALDEGRDVLAVAGNIFDKNSLGANNLIKNGAHLVSSIEDITSLYF